MVEQFAADSGFLALEIVFQQATKYIPHLRVGRRAAHQGVNSLGYLQVLFLWGKLLRPDDNER
jgi:hypothetical protein